MANFNHDGIPYTYTDFFILEKINDRLTEDLENESPPLSDRDKFVHRIALNSLDTGICRLFLSDDNVRYRHIPEYIMEKLNPTVGNTITYD